MVLCTVGPLVPGMFSGTATPRKVLLETSVHGKDLSSHPRPLTVLCTRQVLNRLGSQASGRFGTCTWGTHIGGFRKVSGKWGLFPQVVMMFTPRLPDMGPGGPPSPISAFLAVD